MDLTDGTLVFSLPLFLMQVKPGSMAPCYNNNYDDDTDGDDSDTAHCYTSNSSDVAAFRRSCCTFRRWHKRYGKIEFTFTYNNSSLAQVT